MSSLPEHLAVALRRWLPEQRWFGAKGRSVHDVGLVRAVELDGSVLIVVAAVHLDDETQHYQLPVRVRQGHFRQSEVEADLIGRFGDTTVYDATGDPEAMRVVLRMIARGEQRSGVRFSPDRRLSVVDDINGVRRIGTEQSNTSVVFDDRYILKLFRRLAAGVNPDLEVHRALAGSPNMARLAGAIEGDAGFGPVTFGVLHSFAATAATGWELATEAARGDADSMASELHELGAALAGVHRSLAVAFGTSELDASHEHQRMIARLDLAVRQVPTLTVYADSLRARFDSMLALPPGENVQRVHGDLHLGQLLRTPDRWIFIDFEGEPSAPIDERVTMRSPLQDVAGMLRSLDYAAGHVARLAPPFARGARSWASRARAEFLAGYGIDAEHKELLGAYELDKAVYEVRYETGNRPDWVSVPMRAIDEFTGGIHSGR
jgi:maltokinase